MPTVSVVIPTYNRANLIPRAVESVLGQTYRDFEIITVDDGSTDNTRQQLASFSDAVQYFFKPNGGQGSARNVGIRVAQGKYIAFLDSDDLWLPTKLEQQLAVLISDRYAWVYSDAELFDGASGKSFGVYSQKAFRAYHGNIARPLFLGDFIASATPVVRRDVFQEVGFFDESDLLRLGEDWDMWLRIAARHPIAYVPKVLARYRQHAGNATRGENPLRFHERSEAVINRAVAFAPEVYGPFRQAALAMQCTRTGRTLAGQGDISGARHMFRQAINYWPGNLSAFVLWTVTFLGAKILRRLIALNRFRKQVEVFRPVPSHDRAQR